MRVLVVGAGIGGVAAAAALAQRGVVVDLVERQPDLDSAGAGMTLLNPALRALDQLGVLPQVIARGFPMQDMRFCDAAGNVLNRVATLDPGAPERPGHVGILRRELRGLLHEAAVAAGATIRTGTTAELGDITAVPVPVSFSDGTEQTYDLVVGADGIHSGIRAQAFGDVGEPEFQYQAVWRATLERPAEIREYSLFFGPRTKAGINPISEDQLYLLLVQSADDQSRLPADEQPARLRELLQDFDGPIAGLRDTITDAAAIDYRPLESGLVPRPWYRGRIVLVGDAAHSATPHLASGAGMAIEDGIVLAEEIARDGSVDAGLERFMERRWERCRMVVENSLQLSRWDRAPDTPGADPGGFTSRSHAILAQPF